MSLNAVGMEQGPQPSGLSSMTGGIKEAFPAMLAFSITCNVISAKVRFRYMKGKVDLVTSAVSKYQALRVRSFGVIRSVEISFDAKSLGSWYIKEADKSVTRVDSSAPLMYHDPGVILHH